MPTELVEETKRRRPAAPSNLEAAGRALWRRLNAELDFEPREVIILTQACLIADRIAQLEADVELRGVVVRGSKGQSRLNPTVTEIRQQQLALMRLLESLDIPSEDEDEGRSLASRRGRRAANARWHPATAGQLRVDDG